MGWKVQNVRSKNVRTKDDRTSYEVRVFEQNVGARCIETLQNDSK